MPESQAKRPRRFRRWHIALSVLLVLVIAAAITLRWFTRTDHLTALLIDKARSALGAELVIGDGAHYELWPKLHLVLPHPSLKASASAAFVQADSLEVTLPLRTLWADRYDIEHVRLIKPTLDLDALKAWSNAQPPSTSAPPDVRFSLHIDDGTVTAGGQPVAQGVTLDFASAGDVTAWLTQIRAQANVGALIPPLNGSADAAVLQIGSTRLEGVHVDVRDDSDKSSAKP
ncbi:MAG: AsmA family protein [Dokdonella sp.]